MERVGDILNGLNERFHKLPGTCPTHGDYQVLKLRTETEGHCPKCFEEQINRQAREEMLAERAALLMKIAHFPAKYLDQKFTPHTPAQKQIRVTARLFRDFIVRENRWAALMLIGKAGTGKTQLACEIGQAFVANLSKSVRYVTASSMIGEVNAAFSTEGKTEEGEKLRFAQYDLLIIDEIDAMRGTVNDKLVLTDIINLRYSNDKPVIAISNQPFEGLEEYIGDRVVDRLHENGFVCTFDWPSFRRNPVG